MQVVTAGSKVRHVSVSCSFDERYKLDGKADSYFEDCEWKRREPL
jgi:hypothetical protein